MTFYGKFRGFRRQKNLSFGQNPLNLMPLYGVPRFHTWPILPLGNQPTHSQIILPDI